MSTHFLVSAGPAAGTGFHHSTVGWPGPPRPQVPNASKSCPHSPSSSGAEAKATGACDCISFPPMSSTTLVFLN